MAAKRRIRRGFWIWLAIILILAAIAVELTVEQRVRIREALSDAELSVNTHRLVLEGLLTQVESDIAMLGGQTVFRRALADPNRLNAGQDAIDSLVAFSAAKPIYAQVRLLDVNGIERIRVDNINGEPSLIPEDQLQDKSNRYYFKEGLALSPGKTYTSPLDLNIERGKIEEPRNPMLRLVRGVYDGDQTRVGFVILNLYGRLFIDYLESVTANQPGVVMLADGSGNWLFADDPEREWAMMYPEQSVSTAPQTLGDSWLDVIGQDPVGTRSGNALIASTTIIPFARLDVANGTGTWYLISRATLEELSLALPAMFANRAPIYLAILGIVLFTVNRFTDVAIDRYRYRQRLRRLAVIDELTSAPNRRYLFDTLKRTCAGLGRGEHQQLGLLFIDLDKFKPINDQFGHDAGDAVLVAIAQRLRAAVRESDFVSRYGGDEFVVVLPGTGGKAQIEFVAKKVLEIFNQPVATFEGHRLSLGASIGLFGTEVADGIDMSSISADEMLRLADEAMYRAKAAGRNRFAWACTVGLKGVGDAPVAGKQQAASTIGARTSASSG